MDGIKSARAQHVFGRANQRSVPDAQASMVAFLMENAVARPRKPSQQKVGLHMWRMRWTNAAESTCGCGCGWALLSK